MRLAAVTQLRVGLRHLGPAIVAASVLLAALAGWVARGQLATIQLEAITLPLQLTLEQLAATDSTAWRMLDQVGVVCGWGP